MTKKAKKQFSVSLIIRKMQVKTTMRYHLILFRMTIIKDSMNNKFWKGYGEKGIYTGTAPMKNSIKVPQSSRNRTAI